MRARLSARRSPWRLRWRRRSRPRPWDGCARCTMTQRLSYSGTFVYQNDGRTETSRITRYVDAAGDIEKLEVMDGCRARSCATRTPCAATCPTAG